MNRGWCYLPKDSSQNQMSRSWVIYYIVLYIVVCFANVPVKLEISSNVGDGGDVESLVESPVGSAEGRHWFPWFQGSDFISGLSWIILFLTEFLEF